MNVTPLALDGAVRDAPGSRPSFFKSTSVSGGAGLIAAGVFSLTACGSLTRPSLTSGFALDGPAP